MLTALFSGVVGALLVFFLGWLREWWREERGRRGLLRLLLSEIEHNAVVVRTVQESGTSLYSSSATTSMKTDTWRESREGISALPPELLQDLDGYYGPLEILLTLLSFPDKDEERMERLFRRMLSEALNRDFVRSRDPWCDYERTMLVAQERARDRIQEYLGRPVWAPLFLRVDRWVLGHSST